MNLGEKLVENGEISRSDVLEAVLFQHVHQEPLGRVALRHRFLSVRQVAELLGIECDHLKKTHESGRSRILSEFAIEMGFLTPAEAEHLLILQINSRPTLEDALVGSGVISKGRLTEFLEAH